MSLTKKQLGIFEYIKRYIEEHQYPPAVRDIASHFNLASAGGVHKHLKNLMEKGYISLDPNVSRSIRILHKTPAEASGPSIRTEAPPALNPAIVELPLLGAVAAGQPIEHFTEGETLALPEFMVRHPHKSYILQVRGNSMVEEAILDGDYVIVEKRDSADNGELVIAMLNFKEATLKRFYNEGNRIRLQPANFEMQPIYADPREVSIQGIVKGVMRSY